MTSPRSTPIDRQITSFGRWLRFANKNDNTITIYVGAARKLAAWLAAERAVTDRDRVEPDHTRDFVISILHARSPGYANNLVRALQQFAKWYAQEEDTDRGFARNMLLAAGFRDATVEVQTGRVHRSGDVALAQRACQRCLLRWSDHVRTGRNVDFRTNAPCAERSNVSGDSDFRRDRESSLSQSKSWQ
jgi:hypothetical protein